MAYKVINRLVASLVVSRDDVGAVQILESSGVDVASLVELGPGIWQFDLTDALAATEENAAIQGYVASPGAPANKLNAPSSFYTPDPLQPRRRILRVTKNDGSANDGDYFVWGHVQLYQITDREQRAA